MPIDKQTFRKALGSLAAGVTVVTTVGGDGKPYGFTATAFTSVSLEPPLVLVCVDKRAESLPHLHESRLFAVNFLAEGHDDASQHFAVSGGDKFIGRQTETAVTGAPLLPDALGYVDCRVVNIVDGGDHTIFIGQVEAAAAREAQHPLLYFRGAYRKLA